MKEKKSTGRLRAILLAILVNLVGIAVYIVLALRVNYIVAFLALIVIELFASRYIYRQEKKDKSLGPQPFVSTQSEPTLPPLGTQASASTAARTEKDPWEM